MPSFYESFGMVALEAMACGTPVIASQVGGLAFLVRDGETGFTVPEGDPAALCDKLTLLLSDQKLREQMADRAAEYAQGYKWEKIAAQIVDVYEGLIGK
jgi:D-inositol-3-phosphate glycosyltransferase